jgi:hypothetical protein
MLPRPSEVIYERIAENDASFRLGVGEAVGRGRERGREFRNRSRGGGFGDWRKGKGEGVFDLSKGVEGEMKRAGGIQGDRQEKTLKNESGWRLGYEESGMRSEGVKTHAVKTESEHRTQRVKGVHLTIASDIVSS